MFFMLSLYYCSDVRGHPSQSLNKPVQKPASAATTVSQGSQYNRTIAPCPTSPRPRNDGAFSAGPALNTKPLLTPALHQTSSRRNEDNNEGHVTNDAERRSQNEDQSGRQRTAADVHATGEDAVPVADNAQSDQAPWHTVRRNHRRKKNNKISV